jgi:hypothetical protein
MSEEEFDLENIDLYPEDEDDDVLPKSDEDDDETDWLAIDDGTDDDPEDALLDLDISDIKEDISE